MDSIIGLVSPKWARPSATYILKHRSRYYKVILESILNSLDLEIFQAIDSDQLGLNDIGQVKIKAQSPNGAVDTYENSRLWETVLHLLDSY